VNLELRGVEGLPEIHPGDDLAALIFEQSGALHDGDVVVVAQKVVSKSEGRIRRLSEVSPSAQALQLAPGLDADPRMVQVVLDETARIVRADRRRLLERALA
jgi:coenzyme F420-0:L-glutamate ligase/coenzyme F420-1:gamma-L-glutamate ligase